MDQVRADIKLSTGRIVKHTRQENGSQLATPTPGCYEMTNQEYIEYCRIIYCYRAAKQGFQPLSFNTWYSCYKAKIVL